MVGALSLSVFVAACADGDTPDDMVFGPPGSDTSAPSPETPPTAQTTRGDDGGGRGSSGDGDGGSRPESRPTRTTDPGGLAPSAGDVDDAGPVGSAGAVLLSPSSSSVVIEIDRSANGSLRADAAAVLGEELREHGGKQQILRGGDSQVPSKDIYSAADLRSITADHRATRSSTDRPSIYVLVLEGRFENERATGVAFSATAFAIFPDQLGGGLLGTQRAQFETAVLVHELGHLFGLVDLTGQGDFHEDPDHPGHSRNEGSVMYWAIEDVSLRTIFEGGPPTEFDRYDREEMARIRS